MLILNNVVFFSNICTIAITSLVSILAINLLNLRGMLTKRTIVIHYLIATWYSVLSACFIKLDGSVAFRVELHRPFRHFSFVGKYVNAVLLAAVDIAVYGDAE